MYITHVKITHLICHIIIVIAVQEHWLTADKLHLLSTVSDEFGISGVNSELQSHIYMSRPFGGVGFLWHKKHSRKITALKAGRCLAIQFNITRNKTLIFLLLCIFHANEIVMNTGVS